MNPITDEAKAMHEALTILASTICKELTTSYLHGRLRELGIADPERYHITWGPEEKS